MARTSPAPRCPTRKAAALNGIEFVRKNAADGKIEDGTGKEAAGKRSRQESRSPPFLALGRRALLRCASVDVFERHGREVVRQLHAGRVIRAVAVRNLVEVLLVVV